jgi:hypothetical protein
VIYDNAPNLKNYLSNSEINYADISNYTQLVEACAEDCPYENDLKCPCVGVYDKVFKKCEMGVFDENTCEPTSSGSIKDTVEMKGSLTASCYCFELMKNNIDKYGVVKGMSKSYTTDNDLCTPVFEIFAVAPLFRVIVSMTTAVVNILLKYNIKHSAQSEGHINLSYLEMNVFIRMFLAQLVNTIVIPLAVSGRPKQGWPFAFLGQIFTGSLTDFIYLDHGRVERGW